MDLVEPAAWELDEVSGNRLVHVSCLDSAPEWKDTKNQKDLLGPVDTNSSLRVLNYWYCSY